MQLPRTIPAIAAAVLLTACATQPTNPNVWRSHWGVVFDGFNRSSEDRSRFGVDAEQCREISVANDPAGHAVAGAIVGALLGAAIFRASGLSGNRGAAFGAVPGALGGAGEGARDAKTLFRNCMGGRNWVPLN